MICNQCGIDTGDHAQFCRKCGGRSIGTVSTPATSGAAAALAPARYQDSQSQPKELEPDVAVWVLLPILFLGIWFMTTSVRELQKLSTPSRVEQIAVTPVTVNANGYYHYEFKVPSGARNAVVQGHFSAAGGSEDAIEAYILSKDDFENWREGQPIRSWYRSGKVNRSTVKTPVGADGVYYLVLNNQFDPHSSKLIRIDVTLTYDL